MRGERQRQRTREERRALLLQIYFFAMGTAALILAILAGVLLCM